MKWLLVGLIMLSLMSCASMERGSYQVIDIVAYDAQTNERVSCDCELKNDDGTYIGHSDRPVRVHRDKDLLHITCENEEYVGCSSVDGKVNGKYVFNDFFWIDALLISGWVDGLSGAWSEYPNYISVPMTRKKEPIKEDEL